MAVNKVVYGVETIIDLTQDTVTADTLLAGATAHDASGEPIDGKVTFASVYSGAEEPAAALGMDGDIYLML